MSYVQQYKVVKLKSSICTFYQWFCRWCSTLLCLSVRSLEVPSTVIELFIDLLRLHLGRA
jgi:hypothetical protein